MKKQLLASLLLMLIWSGQALAQSRTVTGIVRGTDGATLPGVNVLVKGTNAGTTTDGRGAYSIAVPEEATLVFSFISFITQEVPVGNRSTLDVRLVEDVKQLNEVVVVGYGTQERKDLTGSVASIKGESISNLATPSFDQQLAGRAAGVQVTVPNGVMGQPARIRIRGTNSITSSAAPLIVVDGIPIIAGDQQSSGGGTASNPLADINPEDIESFEVLKDGSATAIYGSRAANGVILITTKKGKQGKPKVSYNAWMGLANVSSRFDLLNAEEFITISNEKRTNVGLSQIARPQYDANASGDSSLVNTDWQDYIFRQGFQQNHALSVGGGSEKTSYYFSLGWTDQRGAVVSNEFSRATFRANIDQKIGRWLSIGANMGLSRSRTIGLNTGRGSLSGNVANASVLFPNVRVYNPDGTYNISPDAVALGQGNNLVGIGFNYPNIKFVLDNNKNNSTLYRTLGNVYLESSPIDGLRLRTQYGIDLLLVDDYSYWDPRHGDGRGPGGFISRSFTPNFRWNWQNTVNYDRIIAEDHKIGLVAGVEFQQQRSEYYSAQVSSVSNDFFKNIVSGTFATPNISGRVLQNGFDSYFGRINYGFRDKYLATFTLRNDGISDLPYTNRRGTFPGVSIGWRVSEEGFFENLKSVVNDFKIRGSWAEVGNVDIGYYPYLGTYSAAQYADQNGIAFSNVGNGDLRWERSKKLDIGVDLALFSNRITLNADYYVNNVDGLILAAPTAYSLGVPGNSINKNVGAMRNSGIELQVSSENIRKENFSWSSSVNFSTNRNEVKALNENQDILSTYNVVRIGEPVGAIYGYEYAGVNPANGNPLYRKANGQLIQGNVVNTLTTGSNVNQYFLYDPGNPSDLSQQSSLDAVEDRKVIGNANPLWFGGITNTFKYRGFDLEIFARFSGGNKILNVTRQQQLRMEFVNNHQDILRRWTADGQQTDVPRLAYENSDFVNLNNFASTRFLEKGDFFRLQNVTLGYNVPNSLLSRVNISSVRVYAQVQNAFVITKYTGLDPEINANNDDQSRVNNIGNSPVNGNTQFGIDYNGNPQQRIFTFGLNVGF